MREDARIELRVYGVNQHPFFFLNFGSNTPDQEELEQWSTVIYKRKGKQLKDGFASDRQGLPDLASSPLAFTLLRRDSPGEALELLYSYKIARWQIVIMW